jgi:hypothetical protein
MMPCNPVIMDRWGRNRGSTMTAGLVIDYKLRLVDMQSNIDSKYNLCRTRLDCGVRTEQNAISLGHGARRSRSRGSVYLQFLSAMLHDSYLVQTKPLRAYLGSGVEKNNRPVTNKRVERLHVRCRADAAGGTKKTE